MKITVLPTTISYMTSQFRWGFELEAYVKGDHSLPDIKKILDDHFQMTGLGVGTDASLPSIRRSTPFEYQSAILDITPTSLKRVGTGLATLDKLGVYVTSQCGFHTHFSHPSLSKNDRKWILLGIAMDEGAIEKLTEFEGTPFWDAKYADTHFLDMLSGAIQNHDNDLISRILRDEKRRLIRLHPQGTLEWRGPRNFLDKADPRISMKFMVRVREVASIFNEKLEAKEVGGRTREDYGLETVRGASNFNPKAHQHKFYGDMELSEIALILTAHPWLHGADFEDAVIHLDQNSAIIWERGTWNDGVWKGGTWMDGMWRGGTWKNGVWKEGTWQGGTWMGGTWENGYWKKGVWTKGTWEDGVWAGGTWKDGTWKDGKWVNGGTWMGGTWENGYWMGGTWENGTWENGTWTSGIWKNGTWKIGQDLRTTEHKNSPDTW